MDRDKEKNKKIESQYVSTNKDNYSVEVEEIIEDIKN